MQKRVISKKILSMTLSLTLCAVLLSSTTACSSKKTSISLDPQNPVSIELWNYYNGAQQEAFDALVTEFNETVGFESGIIVESTSQGSVDELIGKVLDAAQKKVGAQEIPNVFAAYADTAYQVDKSGLVANLNDYLTTEEIGKYRTEYWQEGLLNDDENYKIFPIAKSTEIFAMNKTDWDKFASDTNTSMDDLSTMEGIVETASAYYDWSDKLTVALDDGKAFFGRDSLANYIIIGYKQLGRELFEVTADGAKINLDKKIMRTLWDNYYIPFVNGYFTATGKFRSDDIKTGDVIALVGSTSGVTYFPDKVMVSDTESYPIEMVSLPIPIFKGGEKVSVQQGAGMVVTKSTKEEEFASIEFLKWFTQPQRNIDFSIESGYLPVQTEATTEAALNEAFGRIGMDNVKPTLQSSMPVAIKMINDFALYTSPAFDQGSEARYLVQDAINNKANKDSKQVKAMMTNGTSRKEAVSQFTTDENFDEWFAAIDTDLKVLVP